MEWVIAFFTARAFFEPGSSSPQAELDSILNLGFNQTCVFDLLAQLVALLDDALHISAFRADQLPGDLKLFIVFDLNFISSREFMRVVAPSRLIGRASLLRRRVGVLVRVLFGESSNSPFSLIHASAFLMTLAAGFMVRTGVSSRAIYADVLLTDFGVFEVAALLRAFKLWLHRDLIYNLQFADVTEVSKHRPQLFSTELVFLASDPDVHEGLAPSDLLEQLEEACKLIRFLDFDGEPTVGLSRVTSFF